MQQALAFGLGGALTFYYGFTNLNAQSVESGYYPVGTYKYPTASLNNPIYTPTNGPNMQYPQDFTDEMKKVQQDLINESRLNQMHPILNPFKFRGDNNMGEPAEPVWPQVNLWTSSQPDNMDHEVTHFTPGPMLR